MAPTRFGINLVVLTLVTLFGTSAVNADKEEALKHGKLAEIAVQRADWAAARLEYEKAYIENPEPILNLQIGRCHHLDRRYQEALSQYEKYAIGMRNQNIPLGDDYWKNLAEAYDALDRPAEALQAYNQLITEYPSTKFRPDESIIARLQKREEKRRRPLYKTPWFWGVIGGSVAIVATGLGVGLYFGLRRDGGSNPSPSPNPCGMVQGCVN